MQRTIRALPRSEVCFLINRNSTSPKNNAGRNHSTERPQKLMVESRAKGMYEPKEAVSKRAENKIVNTEKAKYGMKIACAFFLMNEVRACSVAWVWDNNIPDKIKNSGIWKE